MVKNSKGFLSGNTRKLRGKGRRGITITQIIKEFSIGERAVICPKAIKEGMPSMRYRGRVGKVVGKQGDAYIVEVKDWGKAKRIIALPIHLEKGA